MKRNHFILGIALMIGAVLDTALTAYADSLSYIDADGSTKTVETTVLTNDSSTGLSAGWY